MAGPARPLALLGELWVAVAQSDLPVDLVARLLLIVTKTA